MGKLSLVILVLAVAGNLSFAQGQQVLAPEKEQHSGHLQKVDHSTSNSTIHTFVCRRCGSENHLEWEFPAREKGLQMIPHCGFCGKKYWPNFKPSGFLERSYCSLKSPEPGLN
jgi:hypothetical protein